ncbi:Nif11 family protein [Synechococcus lacustris]|uniref:Nif11 family protein n=1 Tax=Synechococcus lacustris TaxID=2116544 RepID=UPI0020CBCEF3|nr:Nif11 family protein [Synechococcus lacustris]MCP9810615.1 Nif11 family protein [Synechococcus lacustris Maggiore-St4-Slac]
MSWFELERLVDDAEKEPQLARALRHCRINPELVLAARRLGYRITRVDLVQARLADQKEHKQQNHVVRLSY